MGKRNWNRKGFTLAEETITVLLIGILIVSASGILLSAMRFFCRNVITLTAQTKGLAVMEQLQENLEYAKDIQVQSGTDFPAGDENCAYQMLLWTDQDPDSGDYVLKASEKIQYSNDPPVYSSASENDICKLGKYQALITVNGSGNTIVIHLEIQRYGTTYYSENRTILLKNSLSSAGEVHYSSAGPDSKLYINCLE